MKITTISYQRTIPTGAYANCKIGLEATIGEDEDAEIVAAQLADKVEAIYQSLNIDDQRGTTERIIEVDRPKLTQDEQIIADMNTCTEVKVLESYKLIASAKQNLQVAYDAKMNELKNQQ